MIDTIPSGMEEIARSRAVRGVAERRTVIIMLAMVVPQVVFSLVMVGGPTAAASVLSFRPAATAAWVLGAAVAAAYVGLSMASLPGMRRRIVEFGWVKLASLPFSIGAACLEELLFRRLLMDALSADGMGDVAQVAISAVAFGLAHSVWGALSGSWRGIVMPVLWTSVLGGLLAIVYLLAGRDVAPCIWSHAAINLCLEPWLMISLMTLHRAPAPKPTVGP